MIFVTVGSSPHPFDRLIKKVDEIIKKGNLKDDFFIQLGNSSYVPKYTKKFTTFVKEKEHENYIKNSDLIITHAGLGNIMKSILEEKPVIIVPRRKMFGEHVDDHQLDLSKYFEKKQGCIVLYDLNKLEISIKKLKGKKSIKRNEKSKIFSMIQDFINDVPD